MYYLDSSALVKRYLTEAGSTWLRSLIDPPSDNTVLIAEITQVEVAAAVAARHRAVGGISREVRDGTVNVLAKHCQNEYQLIATNKVILDQAVELTQRYRLRGYDAVQLATALYANSVLVSSGLAALTIVAADKDLLAAAHAEGLIIENPNLQSE